MADGTSDPNTLTFSEWSKRRKELRASERARKQKLEPANAIGGKVSTGITMEQLQEILKHQAELTKGIVKEAVAAAKEPTVEEAAKKAEEKERYERSRKQALAQQEAEYRSKLQRQTNCPHKKENGKWATGGQVIGGRYGMLVCQHCQKSWFANFSQEVIAQLNAGDLTLHQADPTQGWINEEDWYKQQNAEAAVA